MRKLLRLAVVAALAVWVWRTFFARSGAQERVGVSYADGSSLVLEPGSPGFERLAAVARAAVRA
jgi:hypothetical protein